MNFIMGLFKTIGDAVKIFWSANPLATIFTGIFIFLFLSILVPNFSSLSERLGFETKATLKEDISTERANVDKVLDANKNLKKNLDIADKVSEAKIDAIVEDHKVDAEIKKEADKIIREKDRKIADLKTGKITKPSGINLKFWDNPKPEAPLTPETVNLKIAEAQITAIWTAYCGATSDPVCSTLTEGD